MTDRKQKAIDQIWEHLRRFPDFKAPEWYTKRKAEVLYDCIAPLIKGEFPEGLFAAKLHGFYYLCRAEDLSKAVERVLPSFKRLWEGQEAKSVGLRPDAQDDKNRQASEGLARIAARVKGTCQACGGSGEVPVPRKSPKQVSKYWQDCPQCNGTGRIPQSEESKEEGFITASVTNDHPCQVCGGSGVVDGNFYDDEGNPIQGADNCPSCKGTGREAVGECQHKGNQGWRDAENKTGPPICFDCGSEIERRSGEERRDVSEGRRIYDGGDCADHLGGFCVDRRTPPERRKPTGECQHKNIQNIQTDLISLYCDDCKQYVKDRRSGKERRGIKAVGIVYCGKILYGRNIPDGLVADEDRRIKDRRKAVSGEA